MELGRKDVERFVEAQMEAFEDALRPSVDLPTPPLKTLLLALDHSNQDRLVLGLGAELARRFDASVAVTSGFPEELGGELEAYVEEAVAELRRAGRDARPVLAEGEHSFDKTLAALREAEADLLVLPAPYFRDIDSLGEDSVGTNLDVMLARARLPILVARHPDMDPQEVLRHVRLAVFDDEPLSQAAAMWALRLARDELEVLALVEAEFVEMVEDALAREAIPEEELVEGLERSLVPLVSAVLRRCDRANLPCDVKYRLGDLVETIVGRMTRSPGLVVLRGYEARDRPGEKVAREVILRSRVPVLVANRPP